MTLNMDLLIISTFKIVETTLNIYNKLPHAIMILRYNINQSLQQLSITKEIQVESTLLGSNL